MAPTTGTSTLPQVISLASITQEMIKAKTLEETDEEEETRRRKSAHCEPFLPNKILETFVQEDNVKATLDELLGIGEYDPKLPGYVVKEAPRAFLTAIYMEADEKVSLEHLQQERFKDAKLPVKAQRRSPGRYDVCTNGSSQNLSYFSAWKGASAKYYALEQWTFLAPTFNEHDFSYVLHENERPPLVYIPNRDPDAGHFGKVLKLGLRLDHLDFSRRTLEELQLRKTADEEYYEVAVKFMSIEDNMSNSDVEKFYPRERDTLERMRDLDDPHLIKTIAAYEKGKSRCFIFPWAEGGNLDTFWRNNRSHLDKDLVRWALDQMIGIAGGIKKLHAENIRHGDIKPQNILYFPAAGKKHARGTLKIADVGLAKVHTEYTRYRIATTTRMSSERYEPPEMESYLHNILPIPRVYDSWSLGCVFFEFMVWLIYGRPKLDTFHKEIRDSKKFYETKGDFHPRHKAVNDLIEEMEKRLLKTSALGRLVRLISERLLVPADKRMKTKKLHEKLRNISKKCECGTSYYFGSALVSLARDRPVPGHGPDNHPQPPDDYNSHAISTETADKQQQSLSLSKNDCAAISFYVDPDYKGSTPLKAQLGLPILPSPGSPPEFALINDWISLCDRTHDCVSPISHEKSLGQMPTRLIHVGIKDAPSLRLVDTKQENVTGKYIALSHCWGKLSKEERFCTYINNIQNLRTHIPFDKLPQTFKDAVIATRALGVHYLWIDSLCIIQEDAEDWKIEAARMEDVFTSAYCTIAASSSTSSLDGFLTNRRDRAVIGINTRKGPLYLAEAIDDFRQDVEQGILNTRGWVFQERALSRRTIHFTSTQVYWECGHGVHCETLAHLRNRESELLGDSDFPSYGLQKYKDDSIRLVQYLYRTYSGLNLTHPTDHPKAILGLQSRLGDTFQTEAQYGILSAYFERLLLWQRDQPLPLDDIPYPEGQIVPSWSWMSVMGKINYLDVPFGKVNWTGDVVNPFSEHYGKDEVLWDGALQVMAHRLSIGEEILKNRTRIDRTYFKMDPKEIICAVVGTSKLANDDGTTDQYVLLLRWTSPCMYERMGAGVLLDIHIQPESFPVSVY
ncbi:hypothetical protein NW768_011795 [Fusarium equiseti]|uniref:Protein kinase domain-containing protein n=1 Tax=Fusarium equiseti TaxID=61235 RepID=A0ABQ8QWM9_FUSEQ|nr:hypothetical protein NW768_011795 [Fusarium equiseti]